MFSDFLYQYPWDIVKERIYNSTKKDVLKLLDKDITSPDEFYPLFSPVADSYLEELAGLSYRITRKRFGNIIQLYAPLYISNECTNSCIYCGFNVKNRIKRLTLSLEMIEKESAILYDMGFRHILLVSGENRNAVPIAALEKTVQKIHKNFASLSIEVYPMHTEEYTKMVSSGVDGLTVYQETYKKDTYAKVHPAGKKKDYYWRLHAPDRGGEAGFRKIGIGTLLGLSDWRVDGFFTALHAFYLLKKYWTSHIQVSFPRIKESEGDYVPENPVNDRDLTHLISIMRIIHPDVGIVLSTRESSYLRDNVIPIGITMVSAGSRTEPGGYSKPGAALEQFKIDDTRSPQVIADVIRNSRLDPVWKDWDRRFLD